MKVGFIGLGMMGSGMARNLIKAGHALVVFNRTRSRAQELAQLGATVAATPGEAAGSAEVQITMLFDAMGQKTFVLDENAPAANVVKLTGNFLISTVIESMAEAMSLVRKSGVDPNKFLDVLTGSLFSAPIYKNYGGMIAANRFEPVGFKLPLGFKDNRLVLAAAEEAAVPMASLVHDRFVDAIAQGLTEADWTAIARISFQRAGLEKAA